MSGMWLVETTPRGSGPHEWRVRSGHDTERSARYEASQCGYRWRGQGYKVRVRPQEERKDDR